MTLRLETVTYEAVEPTRLAQFWGGILGRTPQDAAHGVTLPGTDTQVGLRFAPGQAARPDVRGLHLHLTSTEDGDQQRTVDRALELGAKHIDVGQLPDEGHIVLADPEGNPFCVIEAHNSYLDGTGFLGEVACDGTRELGLFWQAALEWPLVWDQDEETVVQSPLGGTKVAWGGPPLAPKSGRNQQLFDLVTDLPMAEERDRLVSLGATVITEFDDGTVEFADVDGNEFRVSPA